MRTKVLEHLDEAEIVRLLRVWDQRRGAIDADLILSHPLALPAQATLDDGTAVPLFERLGLLFSRLLLSERLGELHGEQILDAAPAWASPV